MVYTVIYVDENGCRASDEVAIKYESLIYVPNTFTANNDGFNDVFMVQGGNIVDFEIIIFKRGGDVVYEAASIEEGCDGNYNGHVCQDGTYVWNIIYEDKKLVRNEIIGHVNLLR